MRLVKGGPRVAVRIWFGAAIIAGEEQDRCHDWHCEIDGVTDEIEEGEGGYRCTVALSVDKAWPFCAKQPIDQEEYDYLRGVAGWAKTHAPAHPAASPRKRVDLAKMAGRF